MSYPNKKYAEDLAVRVGENPAFVDISSSYVAAFAMRFGAGDERFPDTDEGEALRDKMTALLSEWARAEGRDGWLQLITWAQDNRNAVRPQRSNGEPATEVDAFGIMAALIEDAEKRQRMLRSVVNNFRYEFVADGVEVSPDSTPEEASKIIAADPEVTDEVLNLSIEQIADRLAIVAWPSDCVASEWLPRHGREALPARGC